MVIYILLENTILLINLNYTILKEIADVVNNFFNR